MELVTGAPLVVQVMVYVDCAVMVTACELDLLVLESPGPETVQEFTPVAPHVIVEESPENTLDGLAEMVAFGAKTSIEAKDGGEFTPAPEQMTW